MSFNTVTYYETGELKTEMNIIDGKIQGVVKNYWKSGGLQHEATYLDDKLHGESKSFDEEGRLTSSTTFTNGSSPERSDGAWPPEEE